MGWGPSLRREQDLRLGSRGATSDCTTLKLPWADAPPPPPLPLSPPGGGEQGM